MTDEVERCFRYVLSRDVDKRNSITIDGYTGFLFFNTQGNPKTLRNLQNTLHNVITAHNKVRPDCQIPQITPHVLRHTFLYKLINAGLGVKDVQYLMGHSSAAITLDVYSHVDISSAGDKHDPGPGRKSITTPLWPNCYTTYYTIWSQNGVEIWRFLLQLYLAQGHTWM